MHKLCYAGPGEAGPRPEGRAAESERKGGRGGGRAAEGGTQARKHRSTEARKTDGGTEAEDERPEGPQGVA